MVKQEIIIYENIEYKFSYLRIWDNRFFSWYIISVSIWDTYVEWYFTWLGKRFSYERVNCLGAFDFWESYEKQVSFQRDGSYPGGLAFANNDILIVGLRCTSHIFFSWLSDTVCSISSIIRSMTKLVHFREIWHEMGFIESV